MTHDPLCPWNQPCPGSYKEVAHELVPLDGTNPDYLACYNCTSTECLCDLIANVRKDERLKEVNGQIIISAAKVHELIKQAEAEMQQAFQHGLEVGQRDALATAVQRVEAAWDLDVAPTSRHSHGDHCSDCAPWRAAIAAIKGDNDEA